MKRKKNPVNPAKKESPSVESASKRMSAGYTAGKASLGPKKSPKELYDASREAWRKTDMKSTRDQLKRDWAKYNASKKK